MLESKEKTVPEAAAAHGDRAERGFAKIEMLLNATGGLSLSQVCSVTGLEGSTIQNWVKRGWVTNPKGKKYEEVHISRILIINALKECIKLEHISLLMSYVNYSDTEEDEAAIKESQLYNYLCDALSRMGQANDHSRGGVESVVETVIKDYKGPRPDSRVRIRNALTLMIFACVCTDVKRRTEAMMGQILEDLENPERIEAEVKASNKADRVSDMLEEIEAARASDEGWLQADSEQHTQYEEAQSSIVARKTVSQALREWDVSGAERATSDYSDEVRETNTGATDEDKPSSRPWYLRRGGR